LELFLNRLGRRVYFKEVGGLFSKRAGLKRYLRISAIGSRSEGSGRRGMFDLILGVGSGSDGSGVLGRGGGGVSPPATLLVAAGR